jgi:predicted tellurium resistance membrane protein TerC
MPQKPPEPRPLPPKMDPEPGFPWDLFEGVEAPRTRRQRLRVVLGIAAAWVVIWLLIAGGVWLVENGHDPTVRATLCTVWSLLAVGAIVWVWAGEKGGSR